MNFGIEGLRMCTTEHYHLQEKLLKVFQKYRQNMMVSTKDVQKERTQRRNFQVARAMQKESWYVYYVFFMDDFSRKTWIYFMKNKYEVFSKFK